MSRGDQAENLTIERIVSQCCVRFSSHEIDCEMVAESSLSTVEFLTELDKL